MNNEEFIMYICLNLLTLFNYIGGLRGANCCGQGRQPQQLSEEDYYLLRVEEEPEQLEELFAAVID